MFVSKSVMVLGAALTFSASAFAGNPPASADATASLNRLRTTLHTLDATSAIKGVLEVKSHKTKGSDDSAKKHAARLTLQVQAQDGLSMHYPAALLHKVAAERKAHAADADHATPTADLLGQIGASDAEGTVSMAPSLLRMLAHAQSPSVKPVQWGGKSVQRLDVTLPKPKPGANSFANLKDYSGSASVWIGTDGTPLAYATLFKGKFCKFLLCMSITQNLSGTLRVVDERLVAIKRIVKNKQSGLGMDSASKTIYTFRVTTSQPDAHAKTTAVHDENHSASDG